MRGGPGAGLDLERLVQSIPGGNVDHGGTGSIAGRQAARQHIHGFRHIDMEQARIDAGGIAGPGYAVDDILDLRVLSARMQAAVLIGNDIGGLEQ